MKQLIPAVVCFCSDITEVATVMKIIWKELLAYIHFYCNNTNSKALNQVVLHFFSPSDISEGKSLLVQELSLLLPAHG